MAVAATTELECINIMLAAIGEAPINTLTGTLPVDAVTAQRTLAEINKDVQNEGWSFNQEFNVKLTRDGSNQIALGTDMLKVDANVFDHPTIDVIQRGLKMYDRKNNTYVFDTDLTCNITYFRNFDEIPESARRYINIRAARVFVDRLVGDDGLRTYTAQDEARARANLMENDMDNADHNVLSGDPNLNNAMNTFTPADVLNR
jgi:hypothetical protein|tara:strand:+ start:1170 stop:1778 length:609 start_codon:yes stop_codon:yes gene_type:complete